MNRNVLAMSWVIMPGNCIHNRKATKVSPLRKRVMEMIITAILEKRPLKSVVIHQHNTKTKRTIRLAVGKIIPSETGQKVYRVILWIKHTVINVAGKLETFWHKQRIAFPIPLEQGV
jgi:hypothetical protein